MSTNKMLGLIWLDLETTGLDPRKDKILEIAVEVPDDSSGLESVLVKNDVAACKALADDYVRKMHTDSGLWSDLANAEYTAEEIDAILAERFEISETDRMAGLRWVLAGNSVHFDLGFIRVHMPRFARCLSHRVFDVSTLLLLAEVLGLDIERETPAHRAEDDVLTSQRTADRVVLALEGMSQ